MRANANVQPDAERNLVVEGRKTVPGIKARNDADSGRIRIATYEMICDGFWMMQIMSLRETFMTKEILGLDTFQILLGGRFCLIEILQ